MADDDKGRLGKSLEAFGDLGCIVLNRRSGYLIGGHQRTAVMEGAEIEATDLPEPEEDGTVARGWLTYRGRRFALRVVDWDEATANAAMVSANRFGRVGSDDMKTLKDLLEELDTGAFDMDLTGFEEEALEELMTQSAPQEDVLDLRPFKRLHFLISASATDDVGNGLLPELEALAAKYGAELSHAAN